MIDPTFGWGTIVINALVGFLSRLFGFVFGRLFTLLYELIGGLGNLIFSGFTSVFGGITGYFGDWWKEISGAWKTITQFIKNIWEFSLWLMDTFNWLYDHLKKAYRFAKRFKNWLFGEDDEFSE